MAKRRASFSGQQENGQYEVDAHKLPFLEFGSSGKVPWRSFPFRSKAQSSAGEWSATDTFPFFLENYREEKNWRRIFLGVNPLNGRANPFHWHGAPGRIRTCDLRIRSPLLYPAELQAHEILFKCLHHLPGKFNKLPLKGAWCGIKRIFLFYVYFS